MKTDLEKVKLDVSRSIIKRHEDAKKTIKESLDVIFSKSDDMVKGNHEEKLNNLKNELDALLLD